MDSLSPELIRAIFSQLEDKLDIGQLRLIQRTFAELGKEALFNCIYVQPSQHSLSRLIEISRHPSCAQYVRTVALSVDAMKVVVWRPLNQQLRSKGLDKLDYRTLIVFRSLVNECQEFQKSSDYAAMFSAAFCRLPRLSTIALREISPSTCSQSEAVTLMDRYAHAVDPPHFHGSWGERDHLRAFSALIDAAYFAGTSLNAFTTTGLIDQAMFDNPQLLQRATSVFKSCRVIKLLFCGETPSPVIYEAPVASRMLENSLFNVISPAMGLKELTVKFNTCPAAGQGGELFSKVFGEEHVWPQLREVGIGAINLPYEELLEFLGRHKATLRGLSISCCELVGGSWSSVMSFLEEKMALERLELDGLLADGYGRIYSSRDAKTMVDYVLRGGIYLPEEI